MPLALRLSRHSLHSAAVAALGVLLATSYLALAPLPAVATTDYQVNLGPAIYSSANPIQRDTTLFETIPSVYDATMRCAALAAVRRVSPFTRIVSTTSAINNMGSANSASARAYTDDFRITGPAGPPSVTGTMYFHVAATLSQSGGFPGPDPFFIQDAYFNFSVVAGGNQQSGGYTVSNSVARTGGYGALTGQTAPFSLVVPVTGTFPVGTPFIVELSAQAGGNTSLDQTNSPAEISANGGGGSPWSNLLGLSLGDGAGHVMDLPAGYTLTSIDWGVAGNNVGVDIDRRGSSGMRLDAAPNPFVSESRLRFGLDADGDCSLIVVDLSGRRVRTLHQGWADAGPHDATWDGRDDQGRPAALGVYFVVLSGVNGSVSRRVVRVH